MAVLQLQSQPLQPPPATAAGGLTARHRSCHSCGTGVCLVMQRPLPSEEQRPSCAPCGWGLGCGALVLPTNVADSLGAGCSTGG
jgi:hypothetical protein